MCTVSESQGAVSGDHLISKERDYSEERRRARENIHGFLRRLPVNEAAEELQLLGKIACPIVMMSLLVYSRSIVSMFFLGHLGEIELAGGSLAIGFGNISGLSVIKGLCMGMEPICCQAYGARRWSIVSQTFQKTLCLLLITAIPVSILWLNIEPIFLLLGQDPGNTKIAKVYLAFSIPDLLGQAHLHPLRIFLKTQNLTTPLTISAVCASILHLPINYFLAIYLNLGVKGVALASAWNTWNMNACLIVYLILSNAPLKPWYGAAFLSNFQGWQPLLALALPSACSVCLEWWWYEIMLFLCGLLSNPQASVAAMGILLQTTGLLYVFPYSLSSGISTRIGHELGAGQPSRAKWTTTIGFIVAVVLGLSAVAFTIAVRSVWGKLFTSEPQVLALISGVLPILGFCELGNSPQTVACGVLTGSARPTVGARINLYAFYLVGLPVAILMGFVFKMGFRGLWFGLLAAQTSCACMMVYTLIQTDWRHQAKRAEDLTLATGDNDDLEASLLP